MKKFLRLFAFALLFLPLLIAAQTPVDAAPPAVAIDGITGFLISAVTKFPWLSTVILVIGTLRLLLKPIMLAIEYYTKSTPNPDDDVAVLKFEAGPIYKWLAIGLDFIGSIKLPVIGPPPKAPSSGTVGLFLAAGLLFFCNGCATNNPDSWVYHISHTSRTDIATYHGHLDLFPEYNQASGAVKNAALWNGWSILPNPIYGTSQMFGLYGGVQNWEQ